jgi:hypothetical protein
VVSLNELYAHLNNRLFNGRLPKNVPVELRNSLSERNLDANLHTEFLESGNKYNIELNHDVHHGIVKRKTAKSLAHEMVHILLYEGGMSVSENSSHGKRFISAMRDIGIVYTVPGEKEKIIPDGPMDRACNELGLMKKHGKEGMRHAPLMCLWEPDVECETQDESTCVCRQEAKRETGRERSAERRRPAHYAPPVYREPPVLQPAPSPRGGYDGQPAQQFRGLNSWVRI